MMKKFYEYIFYKLYKYMQSTRNYEHSAHGALIYLSIIILFNSLTVLVYLKNVFNLNFFNAPVLIIYALVVYYINKKYFDNETTIIKIENKFKNESVRREILGKISVIILIIISFFLLVTSYKGSMIINKVIELHHS